VSIREHGSRINELPEISNQKDFELTANKRSTKIQSLNEYLEKEPGMIDVKVFGTTPPCARCKELTKRASRVAEKYPGKIAVTKFDAMSSEGDKYCIMMTPTLVINEKVVSVGKVPSEEDIEKLIKKEIEGMV
jgi:thiol-disulfide isomerase/thioredoxin